jgi:hypothetical protein
MVERISGVLATGGDSVEVWIGSCIPNATQNRATRDTPSEACLFACLWAHECHSESLDILSILFRDLPYVDLRACDLRCLCV